MARAKPRYQYRPDDLGAQAWESGYLSAWQLARIVAWKSAIAVAGLTVNEEDDVRAQTGKAVDALSSWRSCSSLTNLPPMEWDRWRDDARTAIGQHGRSGLLKLRGIGYPVATAVLSILNPHAWPVIDRWSVQTVFGLRAGDTKPRFTSALYVTFTKHLASVGADCWGANMSIHELDQRAMNAARNGAALPSDWQFAQLP